MFQRLMSFLVRALIIGALAVFILKVFYVDRTIGSVLAGLAALGAFVWVHQG
ncbi:MAG: hypothetical protein M3Z22_01745 [Verrucomicrobiota bacterium]|nr:hypothetical protein [Verrucomicrobiota bacterium]